MTKTNSGYGTNDTRVSNDSAEGDSRTSCFGALTTLPNSAWELGWFQSVRGSEWLQLYLLVIKDLAWAQGWYVVGMCFGVAAVLWSIHLLYLSLKLEHYIESWHYVALLLWLFGNFWWMWGDLHDLAYPSEDAMYKTSKFQGMIILGIAMSWMLLYYIIVRPFKLLPSPPYEVDYFYSQSEVKPPAHLHLLFLFPTWRQYEHVHILLWLGKDISYCLFSPTLWCICTFLTLFVACDFVVTTSFYRGMAVDHVHFIALLLWVLAAAAWTGDELIIRHSDDDAAVPLFSVAPASLHSGRWCCACILILALVMLAALHAVWLAASDRIRARPSAARRE